MVSTLSRFCDGLSARTWVGAFAVVVCAAMLPLRNATGGIKAGVSVKDITLAGVEFRAGPPHVHDPLYARAIVLSDGENKVAIVGMDTCLPGAPGWGYAPGQEKFRKSTSGPFRERVRKALGIEHLLINASHTHSDGRGGRKPAWVARCQQLLFDAVKEADENCTAPVSLHAGRAAVKIGGNRYARGFTTAVVPWVNVLQARTKEGKTLALLFEHAAHPVLTINGGGLSADYPGHAITRIRKQLGPDAVPIFLQGCSGNINANPVGFTVKSGQHKNAENAGRKLGDAVLKAIRDSKPITADTLTIRSTTAMLPLRAPSKQQVAARVAEFRKDNPDKPLSGKLADLHRMWESDQPPAQPFEINAVMLGREWLLVMMAGEVFADYELWLDKNAPFPHTMACSLTNAYLGYVGTDRGYALIAKKPSAAAGCRNCADPRFRDSRSEMNFPLAVGTEAAVKKAIESLWKKQP
jgi:hypothetical protein